MILKRERDWREIGRIQAEAEESEMFPEASSNINGTRAWRCSQTYQLVFVLMQPLDEKSCDMIC